MQIKILFDSEAVDRAFAIGWGISVLIDGHILFDTGERGDLLLTNMRKMHIDPEGIDAVVISHDHWDHTGGLWEIMREREGIYVYALPNFSLEFKDKVRDLKGRLVEKKNFFEIARDVFITGEIAGTYNDRYLPEQAVAVRTEKGITVLTGCAHPGIVKIIERVRENLSGQRIYLVLGGFHLRHDDRRMTEMIVDRFKDMGCEKVGPTHCTGKEAEAVFEMAYREDCLKIKVGQEILI